MQYAGFWKRLSSVILDFIILMPISIFILWVGSFSKTIHLIVIIPHTLLFFAYHIYMNANYGGTFGKLIMGIKITKVDGETIHYKEAFLRNIVDLSFGIIIVFMQAYTLFNISDPSYDNLSWFKQAVFLHENMPQAYNPIYTASQIWIWSELIVLLFNQKKRALHDFIAGTVVLDIKKKVLPDIPTEDKLDAILLKLNK
ncbi:MAG: RDD family protein [Pseudomonadota bacterium]